jgi:hypothetical protein
VDEGDEDKYTAGALCQGRKRKQNGTRMKKYAGSVPTPGWRVREGILECGVYIVHTLFYMYFGTDTPQRTHPT